MATSKPTTVREISGKGYVKATTVLDDETGKVKCYRMGGIPYAPPLDASQRWQRARPLSPDYSYGSEAAPTDFTGLSNECPQIDPSRERVNEDCLQLNIWVPPKPPPKDGWPVFFYIHGGYLQVGSPNDDDPSALITELGLDLVFVFPAYRMNAFGFLASTELATAADPNGGGGGTIGNLGFWDQRLALEWVQAHVAGFGGNPREITVAGLSAGAYSTFHQLAYEVGLPDDAACIRRVVMWSNGCGLPPKPVAEVQTAVDKLLAELLISADLDPQTKLEKLRAEPWEEIVCAVAALPENSFRAVTDGAFVRASLFEELRLGTFAETLRRRGVKIVTGEVRDEINEYREVSPPSSHDGLVTRLAIEYPEVIAKEMGKTYCPNGTLPPDYETWQDLFGKVYSDMQVYVSERGFLSMIAPSLPLSSISRYRIEWRAKCVDDSMPPEKGVSHGSDLEIWFFGDGAVLLPKEKELVRNFLDPWKQFLNGQGFDWGTKSIEDFRMIAEDGHNVSIEKDKRWGECIQIWKSILQMDDTSQ